MTALTFDGRKFKAIGFGSAIDDKFYADYYTSSGQGFRSGINSLRGFSAADAYNTVAYAFRCVTTRASECDRVPFALEDEAGNEVTDDPHFKHLAPSRGLIYDIEASLCLFGQGYALIETNQYGMNPGLAWAATPSITPDYDPYTQKLRWFFRTAPYRQTIQLPNIVYIWNRNYSDENKPGVGETQVAIGPASTLFALDSFTASYFNAGAVPMFIIPVEPSTQDSDIKKEQNFWNRQASGVGRAFRYLVARFQREREPITVGANVKDTQAAELSAEKKKDIAIAHNIPPNIVDGTYKYATAAEEYLGFMAGIIIPRVDRIFSEMNKQFYSRYGLRLISRPKKLEIMQTAFLEQARAVGELLDEKPLTIDEGRAILELPPKSAAAISAPMPVIIDNQPKPAQIAEPKPVNESTTTNDAGLAVSEDATILNGAQIASAIEVLNGVAARSIAELVAVELLIALGIGEEKAKMMVSASKNMDVPASPTKPVVATATMKALTDWRRLSLDHLRLKKSAVIGPPSVAVPLTTAQEIVAELSNCRKAADVRTVFENRINALKRGTNGAQPDATAELKRANDLLERALPFVEVDA